MSYEDYKREHRDPRLDAGYGAPSVERGYGEPFKPHERPVGERSPYRLPNGPTPEENSEQERLREQKEWVELIGSPDWKEQKLKDKLDAIIQSFKIKV